MAHTHVGGKVMYEFTNKPNKELLRELILYIADRCTCDEKFGATKLNKILYFADFLSYAHFGEPITGVSYQRLQNGPAPVPLLPVRKEMIAKGEIALRQQIYYGYPQERIIALRNPVLDGFKARDIALVDSVIQQLMNHNATEVSILSHGRAWEAVHDGERIPYNYVFLSNEGITDLDVSLTHEVLKEISWEKS